MYMRLYLGNFCLVMIIVCQNLNAQIPIVSGRIFVEHFNDISTQDKKLPNGWKLANESLTEQGYWNNTANKHTLPVIVTDNTQIQCGSFLWNGEVVKDKSIGFWQTPSCGNAVSLIGQFINKSSHELEGFYLQYEMKRHRKNNPVVVQLYTSTDGSNWTIQQEGSIPKLIFTQNDVTGYFDRPDFVVKKVYPQLIVPADAVFYIKWVIRANELPSDAISIDNIRIDLGEHPENISFTLKDSSTYRRNKNIVAPAGTLYYTTVIQNRSGAATDDLTLEYLLTEDVEHDSLLVSSALARNDEFYIDLNDSLTHSGNVLDNDFGLPSLTVHSFGTSFNPGIYASGTGGITENGGKIILNANGNFTYQPPAGFSGVDRFAYIATTGEKPDNEAIVELYVGEMAAANNDVYRSFDNHRIICTASNGLLRNDSGSGLRIVSVNDDYSVIGKPLNIDDKGILTLHEDGSFSFLPTDSIEGDIRFNYSVDNGYATTSTAEVTIKFRKIWYINNAYTGVISNGKRNTPFKNIRQFSAINNNEPGNPSEGDAIFIFETDSIYEGRFDLLDEQVLIGQDTRTSLDSILGNYNDSSSAFPQTNAANQKKVFIKTEEQVVDNSYLGDEHNPELSAPYNINGPTIRLGKNNTITGISFWQSSNPISISGNNFGRATLFDVSFDSVLNALHLRNGIADMRIDRLNTQSISNHISLQNISGSIIIKDGRLMDALDHSINIQSSNLNFHFHGKIIQHLTGNSLKIDNVHGGSYYIKSIEERETINRTNILMNNATLTIDTLRIGTMNTYHNNAIRLVGQNTKTVINWCEMYTRHIGFDLSLSGTESKFQIKNGKVFLDGIGFMIGEGQGEPQVDIGLEQLHIVQGLHWQLNGFRGQINIAGVWYQILP